MNRIKLFTAATMLAALVVVASAVTPVGKWNGKISIDASSLPKAPNPQAQAQMTKGLEMVKKMRIVLTFKADHTYSATATGGPAGQSNTDSGTWSQSGNKVTMTGKAKNGSTARKMETLTISSDGKVMTMAFPGGAVKGKVTFTK